MIPPRIEREILIDAPVDVVWAVVTEPEHISGWFSDSVELDLRPGGEAVLVWDGRRTVHGRGGPGRGRAAARPRAGRAPRAAGLLLLPLGRRLRRDAGRVQPQRGRRAHAAEGRGERIRRAPGTRRREAGPFRRPHAGL